MKIVRIVGILSCVGGLAWAAGCSPRSERSTPPAETGALDRAADATRDAAAKAGDTLATGWESVKDATFDERARFRASVSNLAASVDAKIDELQARSGSVSESAREGWDRGLADLRAARADLRRELDELGEATSESWSAAKADVARAWSRVRQSYSELDTRSKAP